MTLWLLLAVRFIEQRGTGKSHRPGGYDASRVNGPPHSDLQGTRTAAIRD
jgi:hypothetical protein